MKKTSAIILAGALLLTGCSSKSVSQSSPESSGSSSAQTSAERKEDIVLTMACSSDPWEGMQELIDRFNAEDNGVRIEIKQFWDSLDENGMPIGMTDDIQKQIDFQVAQELINKDTIDIVGVFSFADGAKYEIFKRKGGFVNLYTFMENDPEVNRDTINSHILDLCERDGKLYSIPTHYWANSMMGKSKYVGTKQNWTIDEFIDRWNAMPEGSTVNRSKTSEGIYYDVLRQNTSAFIDYVNCEVHFDDPDFRKMLEFCKQFPSNMGQKSDDDYNYKTPQLVDNLRLTGYQAAIVSDMDYSNYETRAYRLRDGSYTLVGYPTSDRSGAYLSGQGEVSIRSNISKEKQEAAWKFIREFYLEQYQTDSYAKREEFTNPETGETIVQYSFIDGFPINNAARKKIAQNYLNGEYEGSGNELSVGGKEITQLNELKPEQADIDFIDGYIDSIDRWEFPYTVRDLFWIVEEEVMTYLQDGQDIDTAIEHIQNRASIWISEQA